MTLQKENQRMTGGRHARLAGWLVSLGILFFLAGTLSAAAVYRMPEGTPEAPQYRIVDQQVYPIRGDESKQRIGDLEMYGGKAAVIIDTFDRKLRALFNGRNLARVLAISGALLAAACFFGAWQLRRDPQPT